ncbi:MAG: protein kinase domain-containing protein [Roseimicrobium sp.]
MARLSHRNICRIHEIGEAEGAMFIAMECVDGVSLADILHHSGESSEAGKSSRAARGQSSDLCELVEVVKKSKQASSSSPGAFSNPSPSPASGSSSTSIVLPVPQQRVMALIRVVCEAVQFAHEHGILHRDLKPENIMIRPDGTPVVMDFGLAKMERKEGGQSMSLSIEGQIVGTIEYMAPEQARESKHVTERADVYSLGAILYQLLTGRKHFTSSGSLLADAQKLQDHEPDRLRPLNREVDADLEFIVLKSLRPEPEERYASVRHLLEDLKRYEAGDAIPTRGRQMTYRLTKLLRKNRSVVLFSTALFSLSLFFLIWVLTEQQKQWGGWTEEFAADFANTPQEPAQQERWLLEQFDFQNRSCEASVKPWTVRDGTLVLPKHEWCWLRNVHIRNDTRVVLHLRIHGKPDALQVCLNAKNKLRDWNHNPPGYACRFAIWSGSSDAVSQGAVDAPSDFNDLVVSSAAERFAMNEGITSEATLTFQRRGDKVSLTLDDEPPYEVSFLTPLIGTKGAFDDALDFDRIGLRTWSPDGVISLRKIQVFRYKLAEQASPDITGDALAEAGHIDQAVEKFISVARDYRDVSDAISVPALTKAYLLAADRGDERAQRECLQLLPKQTRADLADHLHRVDEVATFLQWKKASTDRRREALAAFPRIFAATPGTRIAVDCLEQERDWEDSPLRSELIKWVAKTDRLAGLNLSALGLADLQSIETLTSLVCLGCDGNNLRELEALRHMPSLKALYCARNRIATLEPLRGLPLLTLSCEDNQIATLEPLTGMPLYELSCSGNPVTSLEPLRNMTTLGALDCARMQLTTLEPLRNLPLYHLDCSGNALTTLEPFVQQPPASFLFDCPSLPDAELERAIRVWTDQGDAARHHVAYAKFLLTLRRGDMAELPALGLAFQGRRYLYVQKPMSRDEAEQFCQRANAHLAVIRSQEENTFLHQVIPKGASCRIESITTRTPTSAPAWQTGEPVMFTPVPTDFGRTEEGMLWKNGWWFPVEGRKPMAFVMVWDGKP